MQASHHVQSTLGGMMAYIHEVDAVNEDVVLEDDRKGATVLGLIEVPQRHQVTADSVYSALRTRPIAYLGQRMSSSRRLAPLPQRPSAPMIMIRGPVPPEPSQLYQLQHQRSVHRRRRCSAAGQHAGLRCLDTAQWVPSACWTCPMRVATFSMASSPLTCCGDCTKPAAQVPRPHTLLRSQMQPRAGLKHFNLETMP